LAKIIKFNLTVNSIKLDVENIVEKNTAAAIKINSLDNTSNKNKERITKLESRVDKLEDIENSLRLMKEQERRRNMFAVLKSKLQSLSNFEKTFIPTQPNQWSKSTSVSTDLTSGKAEASAYTKPDIGEDILAEARKIIGLFPVQPHHILKWNTNDYSPCLDDNPILEKERMKAAQTFL